MVRVLSALLLFVQLLLWLLIPLRRISRPLWRRLLKWQIAGYRYIASVRPSLQNQDRLIFAQYWLLFEQRASWSLFLRLIEQLPPPNRAVYVVQLVGLYWINGRFDEARDAASYGCQVLDAWVSSHLDETAQVLHLVRQIDWWPLQPQPGPFLSHEDTLVALGQASRLGFTALKAWRDLHVASVLLEWSKSKGDRKAQKIVAKMDVDRNPFMVARFYFNSELATRLGMAPDTFDHICKEAESLDRFSG